MPRVYGNSPGNARSRPKSRSASSSGVASGFTSMPLVVVKSFFHGPFFATAGSRTSRRHFPSSFRTAASASRENSDNCSPPVSRDCGITAAGLAKSASFVAISFTPTELRFFCNRHSEAGLPLLQKCAQPFLRLARSEEERELRPLQRIPSPAPDQLGRDVARERAAAARPSARSLVDQAQPQRLLGAE